MGKKIATEKVEGFDEEPAHHEVKKFSIKKPILIVFSAISCVILFSLFFIFNEISKMPIKREYGLESLKKALIDESIVEDAEVIEETTESYIQDFIIHVRLKIDVEKAKKAVQGNALKRCVGKDNEQEYKCSGPIWDSPGYGPLHTSAWSIKFRQEKNYEDLQTLSINPVTGDLEYWHYDI